MRDLFEREQVVRTAQAMNAAGINSGTSGNVSVRGPHGMWITPSATPYHNMEPGEIVGMSLEGVVFEASNPSTEWPLHAAILAARPEAHAVVHAHPVHATALACLGMEIPAFHYMVAIAGGTSVRCAKYATFGTAELAANVMAALDGRSACLMANHGIVAVGKDLGSALKVALEVENLAKMYLACLSVDRPRILSSAQMDEVLEKFKTYGGARKR